MWTAWHLLDAEPDARVVVLEAGRFGHGPSGRNGGFVNAMWHSLPALRERHGDAAAGEIARATQDAVDGVGRFCSEQGVDAWFRKRGYLQASAAPAQDDAWREVLQACLRLGASDAAVELGAAQVAARCRSPRFRVGVLFPGSATVQPARLAFGLRSRLGDRRVLLFEGSPVEAVRRSAGGIEAVTRAGRVRAGRAVLAIGPALAGHGSPLADRLTVTTSHMVITEPVPDVLEAIGWTGGECITDSRAMVHYFRTTPDGRIAFGWGGGRVAYGARWGRVEVDRRIAARVIEHLREIFPPLAGRRIEWGWGGPIDVSPRHLPAVAELPGGGAFTAFGYTGNGVGPAHVLGRVLASLALDRRDPASRLAIVEPRPKRVPPEPFRWLGGTAIRAATLRKEEAEADGRMPGALASAIAAVPKLIGFHLGR